jgi:hypothetical protein
VREKSDKIEAAEHDQMSAFAGWAQMERSDTYIKIVSNFLATSRKSAREC